MDNVKRALNYLAASIGCILVSVGLAFAAGFIDLSKGDLIYTLLRVSEGVSLLASIFLLVGCLFGKFGKNKNFARAFWINIISIVLSIAVTIIGYAKVEVVWAVVTLISLNTLVQVGTYFFVIFGCREAVPTVSKRAIVTAVFLLLGIALTGAFRCMTDWDSDPAKVLGGFGGIFTLIGTIMFIVLVFKARRKYSK